MNYKYFLLISASLLVGSLSLGLSKAVVANPAILPNGELRDPNDPSYQLHCPQGAQPFINEAYSKYPNNANDVISNLRLASACIELSHGIEPADLEDLVEDFNSSDAHFSEDADAEAQIVEFELAYAGRLDEFRTAYGEDVTLCWPDDIAVDDPNAVTCADLEPEESESLIDNLFEELACVVLDCPE